MPSQLILSTGDLQFQSGTRMDVLAAMPTSGSFTAGDFILDNSTTSGVSGWKRLTTGSGHVLNTDWSYVGTIGYGQTWQVVTRSSGTTYWNTTGKPIVAYITFSNTGGVGIFNAVVGGVALPGINSPSATVLGNATVVIPAGMSYVFTLTGSTWTVMELR